MFLYAGKPVSGVTFRAFSSLVENSVFSVL